jgi:hypothetical protein
MVQQSFDETRGEVLATIDEGMAVYDSNGSKVGVVKYVQNGLGLVDTFVDSPALPSSAPDQMRKQLMQRGFIKIRAGLLASDRYVTADQVRLVQEDRVILNVSDDALLKM